jgi:hypothetical protein
MSLAVATLLAAPGAAQAVPITVTPGLADYDHVAADGACSLREAVTAANQNAANATDCTDGALDVDVIVLPAGTLALDTNGGDEEGNANGDLDIDLAAGPVTLDGADAAPGTTVTTSVDDPAPQRIIHSPVDSTNTLTLRDVTITGGDETATSVGGGVAMAANNNRLVIDHSAITGNAARNAGGGVFSGAGSAEVFVNNSVIRDNQVTGEASIAQGGGIRAVGEMTVTKSVIEGNTVTSTSTTSGHVAEGGGIHVDLQTTSEELVIRDSAIVSNHVQVTPSPPTAAAQGGGVNSRSPVEITNSTFSGNSVSSAAEARGGGLALDAPGGANAFFHNTFDLNNAAGSPTIGEAIAAIGGTATTSAGGNILAAAPNPLETCEQYSPNAAFTLTTDAGGNLDDGTSCGLVSPADESQDIDLNPLATAGAFSPVADTAGPPAGREQLPVHVPAFGSVAIDHATFPADCVDAEEVPSLLTADQRGFPRPVDGDGDSVADCDSGAVEFAPPGPGGATPQPGTQPPIGTTPTGLRAAALKRCAKIKKKSKKRKCKRRARLQPV